MLTQIMANVNYIALALGGLLIVLLVVLFFQLSAGKTVSVTYKGQQAAKKEKIPAEIVVKERSVKPEKAKPVREAREAPAKQEKAAKEKIQKVVPEKVEPGKQKAGFGGLAKKLFGRSPKSETVSPGPEAVRSRMPTLSSLGIKNNKPSGERTDEEKKAMVAQIDLTKTGANLASEKDVLSALEAYVGHATVSETGNEQNALSPADIGPDENSANVVAPPAGLPSSGPAVVAEAPESSPVAGQPPAPVAVSAPVAPPPVTVPAPPIVPPPVQSLAKPPEEKKAEAKKGNIFDAFEDEEFEESESSKVAKTLEHVDIHDLLEESQTLINSLTRRGR